MYILFIMILTESVEVKITLRNIEHFKKFGYDYIYLGCILDIPVALIQRGSQQKILCKCDNCGIEREVIYKNYIKYLGDDTWGKYECRKCCEYKRKNTLMKNHGVEYPYQSDEIRYKNRE